MTNFTEFIKNADQVFECHGCQILGTMFRKRQKLESGKSKFTKVLRCIFHKNFKELELCAQRCATCKVIHRALWLRQLTKHEADMLSAADPQDCVWAELCSTQNKGGANLSGDDTLRVGIGDGALRYRNAVILCSEEKGPEPVNLSAECTQQSVFTETRLWLKDCYDNHTKCKNLSWSLRNPSYLIKITSGSEYLQLVETGGKESVQYTALCYCWGMDLATDEAELAEMTAAKTTRPGDASEGNVDQRLQSFPASSLPKTIRDAVELTGSLKVSYIWVDAICIPQGTDWDDEASKMHEVFGNACVTLAMCSSEKSLDGLPQSRKAWQYRRDCCRLYSGHWLANIDTSLDEIRLRSRLFTRAWTLQEERLSPRILYVSEQRMYWSCIGAQYIEMGGRTQHSRAPGSDHTSWLRHPQEFLETRLRQDVNELHEQWLEMVKVYAKRAMTDTKDRFPAIAGLAVQYLEPFVTNGKVEGEEYLAGLWRRTFSRGLTWSVRVAKDPKHNLWSIAPSWSWASLPVRSDIETLHEDDPIDTLRLVEQPTNRLAEAPNTSLQVVKRGASIRSIRVRGLVRRFLEEQSARVPWDAIQTEGNRKNNFNFSGCVEHYVHCRNLRTGQVLAYEPHKQEITAQLDYLFPEEGDDPWRYISDNDLREIFCLQVGKTSMLLLSKADQTEDERTVDASEDVDQPIFKYRRVCVCNTVRAMFFARAELQTLILV